MTAVPRDKGTILQVCSPDARAQANRRSRAPHTTGMATYGTRRVAWKQARSRASVAKVACAAMKAAYPVALTTGGRATTAAAPAAANAAAPNT